MRKTALEWRFGWFLGTWNVLPYFPFLRNVLLFDKWTQFQCELTTSAKTFAWRFRIWENENETGKLKRRLTKRCSNDRHFSSAYQEESEQSVCFKKNENPSIVNVNVVMIDWLQQIEFRLQLFGGYDQQLYTCTEELCVLL